jgi:predicted ester cyclase
MALDTEQATKALVARCFTELWTMRRPQVAGEILAPGYAGHAPGFRDLRGPEALAGLVRGYHAGFPGLRVTVLGQIGEGDRVSTEFTMTGVHTGNWLGVRATGREMAVGCVAISLLAGGLIVEQWYEWERRRLLEQLGLVPVLSG